MHSRLNQIKIDVQRKVSKRLIKHLTQSDEERKKDIEKEAEELERILGIK